MQGLCFLLVSASIFSTSSNSVIAEDTIVPSSSLSYGQTLVSSGSSFELGFFSPPGSQYRYLGIWYKKIANGTVVWVANRENPLTNDNGFLRLTNEGNLVLFNGEKTIVWSSNSSKFSSNPPVQAQLLDSGNLVVKDKNINGENYYLWQSFDHPSHTLLPGMKLGWTPKTGLNRFLTSWKTQSDPSPGDYTLRIDIRGVPQLVMWKGEKVRVRAGYWNGIRFTGRINENPIQVYQVDFISNQDEVYYTYNLLNQSIVSILSMSQSGYSERSVWIDEKQGWKVFNRLPTNQCDEYNFCGIFGSCNTENTPVCKCLDGFEPRSPVDWNSTNYSGGCSRRTLFECGKGEGFRKFTALKLPDTRNAVADMNMKLGDCEKACLKNCSCIAYALADIRKGNGCLLWFGDLIDIREFSNKGQELYVKMAASELSHTKGLGSKRRLIIIGGVLLISAMLLFLIMWRFLKKKKKKREKQDHNSGKDNEENLELSAFDFDVISTATKDFSANKKLGEGGFGSVYKGQLIGGQEIAVKRLSKDSIQGLNEFKNEVELIAKLQHRNLVKLLGYCIQGEEKLLIYEYLPNKSLDLFIFDHPGNQLLNWGNRYDIIGGIARGLVYLHQDSRLRIIHRDLKASNILLDNEMNPKITDFGLARSFGGDQSAANTNRVVGTYGYMPPEYAVHGHFSVKSDVFSFGVLVLEIVTGKRNRGFQHPDHHLNLLGHAWLLWKNGNPLELIDAPIRNSFVLSQVLKCIHVGLLCVQQSPDDRPCMSSVILMLGSEVVKLPAPKHPGFFTEVSTNQTDSSSSNQQQRSINDITITLLEAR